MPAEYVNTLVKAIAGFEITIDTVDPIFKLSQNKDDITYEKIVNELSSLNDYSANEIADEMVKRRPGLFIS
jgi:transcriptional regulator